jgi:hypothetical protein
VSTVAQGESERVSRTPVASTGRLLFAVVGGPIAWAVHFLGSYALVAVGCVAGWQGVRLSVGVGTVVAAGVALWATLVAWRGWRAESGSQPLDEALGEPRGWFAFLMLTGVMLGAVSAFTILLEGVGSVVLPACGWNVR